MPRSKLARPIAAIWIVAMSILYQPHAVAGPVNTYGIGGATCAQFGEAYKKTPNMTEDIFFTWAQGYLTSVNTQRQILHQKLLDFSPPTFGPNEEKAFIRDTCESNPLKYYVVVVEMLLDKLAKAQGIK